MCELFGLSANNDVGVRYAFEGFKADSNIHRHGWGLAWFSDGGWSAIKESIPAFKSKASGAVSRSARGKIMIGHIRYATKGRVSFSNSHPFIVCVNGVEWVFAHNGDVRDIMSAFELREFSCHGETDSEFAFLLLMEKLKMSNVGSDLGSLIRLIYDLSVEISSYGRFNYLLSNGEYLFAFSDRNLSYVERRAPFPESVVYRGEGFKINLNEVKKPEDRVVIVATDPITIGEKWVKIPKKKLVVFHEGSIVLEYSEDRHFKSPLTMEELEILKFVREKPHAVKIKDIISEFDDLRTEDLVQGLIKEGYLCIDSRDREENYLDKRVYTEPSRRSVIELLSK